MKGEVVNLNRERWLGLANLALEAAGDGAAAKALGEAAGRMVTATPPATERYAMATCTAFRWTCQAFAFAGTGQRTRLKPALIAEAEAVRALFRHQPPPTEAAALPAPSAAPLLDAVAAPAPEHPWMRRADIAGGA